MAKKYKTKEQQRKDEIRRYRQEASRMASKANKRIKRLEKNDLQDSPAYEKYIREGGQKFSVKGKTYNELQKEVARMRGFLDSQSSTIRGYNRVLKDIADNTGIKYASIKVLRVLAPKFFLLASKVEQYLRTVEDMASAISYQQIWESINEYVKEERIDLGDDEANLDEMILRITERLDRQKRDTTIPTGDWFKLR